MKGLYSELVDYSNRGIYPMHMPGHKRNESLLQMVNPYSIDITEIDGFDNMHKPTGIIKNITDRCNKLYGAKQTVISVSGSSIGLLASIAASTKSGDTIIVARNSHKAVYNAVTLNKLKPLYVYPDVNDYGINGEIKIKDIRDCVENSLSNNINPKAVVITSPTYEGIVSDIQNISEYLHSKGIILIVDSAHGAHLGFCNELPDNAIGKGADIVIHSIHKTLPAFTQTALVHISNNNDELCDNVKKYMSIYQSSSPSYVLMAGVDKCISIMENYRGRLFEKYIDNLRWFYLMTSKLKYIKVIQKNDINSHDFDYGKIIITSDYIIKNKNNSVVSIGELIYNNLLYKHNVQLEMKSLNYALAMTSICDTKVGFERLAYGLIDIDKMIDKEYSNIYANKNIFGVDNNVRTTECRVTKKFRNNEDMCSSDNKIKYNEYMNKRMILEQYCIPGDIDNYKYIDIDFEKSIGKISAEYVYMFPPGIPIIVPGEVISEHIHCQIQELIDKGFEIHGIINDKIKVLNINM